MTNDNGPCGARFDFENRLMAAGAKSGYTS